MRRRSVGTSIVLVLLLGGSALSVSACGAGSTTGLQLSGAGSPGGGRTIAGAPLLATKNTTRVDSGDPATVAAASALISFPGGLTQARPSEAVLADAGDWRAALVASVLEGPPLHAPLLLTHGSSIGSAARAALDLLLPSTLVRVGAIAGSPLRAGGGTTGRLDSALRNGPRVVGANPAALAASVAAFAAQSRTTVDNRVLVVSSEQPQFAMPAAAWAAKSGVPILFAARDGVPPETREAIARLQQPRIYVLGPGSAVGSLAIAALQKLGSVKRIDAAEPTTNAIAFARYVDGDFGWGIVNPGHGLVFLDPARPADAAAAAILSASGTYGPSLLLSAKDTLAPALRQYLLDIEPGYTSDPSRGVYNHGWLIGDPGTASLAVQAQIDSLLEIVPAQNSK